ncbi:MAG: OsmC family protein [Balneolaceae bacterium]
MKRTARAVWKGSGTEGSGNLTTQSGAFENQPYSTKMRFENEDGKQGTNPEEMIAAAHAGCFTMALGVALEGAGFTAETLDTNAELTLSKVNGGWEIKTIALELKASVPDISEDEFSEIAKGAKDGCPVSKLLNCEITLDYTLL